MCEMAGQNIKNLRVPPQNIDSEKALLGAIMLKPEALHEIGDVLSADSFYAEKHRLIFNGMIKLFSKSEPIDLLSLTTQLKSTKTLEAVGGSSYLAELVNSVPTASNAEYYSSIVQKNATMRNLISAADHVSELSYDESIDIDELLDQAEKKIYEVTNTTGVHKFISIGQSLGDAWDRIDKLHNSDEEIRGVNSGFPALDNMLAGFQKSDLIILAARPSMGKTTLALDIARQAATQYNIPVGFFSLEMSSQQLVDRMLAAESKVDAWKLRTGKLKNDEDFDKLREGLDRLSKAPIYIDDQPGSTILKMRSVARRLKSEQGLGLIIVDYLQLITPTASKASDNLVQQITEISRSLKHLARELDVPVLALSQLSRAVEQRGGKPRLSDLRDSGSIEQDADVVMFIHREDKANKDKKSDKPGMAEIMIEKHRNGPTGYVELFFDEKRTTFLSVDKSDFGDSTSQDFDNDDF